jgi:hypothetical protein
VRRHNWHRLVIAGALIKVAVAVPCLLAPLSGQDVSPFPVWLNVANLMAFSWAAFLLVAGGRSDARAQWLGAAFLSFATVFADRLLLRAAAVADPSLTIGLQVLVSTRVDAFGPLCLWVFARDFPEAATVGIARTLPTVAIPLALTTAGVLLVANLASLLWRLEQSPVPSWLAPLAITRETQYWTILIVLMLPALIYIVWKERIARPQERRRARLFVSALAAGWTPLLVDVLLEVFVPAFRTWAVQHRGITGILVYPPLLSVPFLTAYAVLVDRALDVHLVIRKALQYALARYATYALLAIPFVGALVYLYVNRDSTILDLLSGRSLLVLAATSASALVAAGYGPKLFDAIDRRFFREQYDARRTLADLIDSSRRATTTGDLAALLNDQIDRALHVRAVALFVDPRGRKFVAPDNLVPALARDAALAVLVGGSPDPLDISLSDAALRRLPEPERQWLHGGSVRLLVPLLGAGGELIGMIALSDKRSELPFSSDDRQLLRDVAASAALALENMLIRTSPMPVGAVSPSRTPDDRRWVETVETWVEEADECMRCGAVQPANEGACSSCGGEVTRACVPRVISGKFQIMCRLGAGGMGVVYLARDLALHRDVAVKTLPRTVADHAERLRREARVMAAVSHPNIAQIFGFETWRNTPILIVEYFQGGTLFDRLRHGQLPESEVVAMGLALADGLDRLHASGLLHRDVKPSNVGFTWDRVPKLLDFGLTKLIETPESWTNPAAENLVRATDAPTKNNLITLTGTMHAPGTPAYMSPEAIRGAPPQPSFDLWALALLLYEAITGRNPVRSENLFEMLDRIERASIPDVRTFVAGCGVSLAGFLADALHNDERRRPSSAQEFRARLSAQR